jgi:hypothetical protein
MSFAWGVRERMRQKKEREDHFAAKKEFGEGSFNY